MSGSLQCDVLVIGTGAGGASVAATLADAGRDVLMLDEGPFIPAAQAPNGIAESMVRMWQGGGLQSTLGSQIAFAEGRCVGGGTEINSAIFQRAPDSILDGWARGASLADFSPAQLALYYERAAKTVNASVTPGEPGPPTDILARAGNAMGWKVSVLERGQRNCVGTNLCSAACPTGGKQSMTATLIPQALARGARLMASCKVTRLMSRNGSVNGAQAVLGDGNEKKSVQIAAKSVFVCAGTIQSAALLRRSGLAPLAGRSFQLHPTIKLLARFPDPVHAEKYRLPLVAITEFMPELRFGGSVFTLGTYGMALAEDWERRGAWLRDHDRHAMYYAMIKPDGVGRIATIPGMADPLTLYRLTERDRRRLATGARDLARALFAAGAEHVTPSIRGHQGWSTMDEVLQETKTPPGDRMTLMSVHVFSSCPMGSDSRYSVTDSFGRVHGMTNLFVADGSLLPGAPGVNPQATIMALAFRAADHFLAA